MGLLWMRGPPAGANAPARLDPDLGRPERRLFTVPMRWLFLGGY